VNQQLLIKEDMKVLNVNWVEEGRRGCKPFSLLAIESTYHFVNLYIQEQALFPTSNFLHFIFTKVTDFIQQQVLFIKQNTLVGPKL
jgi:hypothetical protein